MGEVYRARDSRLDRTVAIKVLPSRLSADPRLRERFEREAKAISSLSHPHICTLYDVGSENGVDFLVMEYLDGESLADRLGKGPLPVEQVIRYGVEIAEALEKAHRAGIVHRDLKPGNVIITKGGAKLLDFGLAKFSQPVVTDPNAPTTAKPLTEEGTIVGTFQYMAPEQIEGRDADHRTDIFALGVLLYEMATGKRAFEAKTRASLIASILDREPPPISTVQPLTPLTLERVVRMCMAKDPDERWQSAHDVAAELKWIATTSTETIGPAAKRRTRRTLLRGAALLILGTLIGAAAMWLAAPREEAPRRPVRFAIGTAENAPVLLNIGMLAFSPDGNYVVYRSKGPGRPHVHVRALDGSLDVALPNTEEARAPVFSPDSRWIAFRKSDGTYKVPREGGAHVKLAQLVGMGMWWEAGQIVSNKSFGGGLVVVPEGGGAERQVVKANPSKDARAVVWPQLLPGGETVIATVWNVGSWDTAKIVAYSTKDGSSKVLIDGGSYARYTESGHLLFLRAGALMAAAFDPKSLRVGTPVVVLRGIAHSSADGDAQFAISRSGDLAYVPGGETRPVSELVWIDRDGKTVPIVPTKRHYGSVAISPDGRSAAVTIEESTYNIWQLDLERDSMTRVSSGGDDIDAIWTPDGNRIIWASSRSGPYTLFWRASDNSSAEEPLHGKDANVFSPALAPDGRTLLFAEIRKSADIWMMPLDTRKPQLLLGNDFHENFPAVSPDGRWLAYASMESGRPEVYLTAFPKPAGTWQVSVSGGINPRWMPNGREIVYTWEGKWYIVPIETEPRPRPGKPRLLFEGDYDDEYDIARDGRIAVIRNSAPATAREINVVLNFGEELKRRVPPL
jgi:eukaryotic-like serine/threonine-protein kinase